MTPTEKAYKEFGEDSEKACKLANLYYFDNKTILKDGKPYAFKSKNIFEIKEEILNDIDSFKGEP